MQVTIYDIMRQFGLLNSILGYMILMSGTDVISIYIFHLIVEGMFYHINQVLQKRLLKQILLSLRLYHLFQTALFHFLWNRLFELVNVVL